MAKLRKFVAYRKLERPYTRVSKYKSKSFIKTKTNVKVVRFATGSMTKKFPYSLHLISKQGIQVRDNALESGRQSCNRLLEKTLGTVGFFMQVRPYPFHILREHALASGAGADRFSSGMAHSFGQPIGSAAQIRKGQIIVVVSVPEQHIETAKLALSRFKNKIPGSYIIQIEKKEANATAAN